MEVTHIMDYKSKKIIDNLETSRNTRNQIDWYQRFSMYIDDNGVPPHMIANLFPVFNSRQSVTRIVEIYEYWKIIEDIPGNIVECGVAGGVFLMSMAHFSSIFEPHHYTRKVIGFDTFEGFPSISEQDKTSKAAHMKPGGLTNDSYNYLNEAIQYFDENRMIGNISKIELHKGDISIKLPEYLKSNPGAIIGLLHLDLDLYKPTKDVLELAWSRMAKGSVLIFDEINHTDYPGETIALMEVIGLDQIKLKRIRPASMAAYCIKGE
jgi:hypothetical protein